MEGKADGLISLLILETQEIFLLGLQSLLSAQADIKPLVVDSVQQLFEQTAERIPDLILLDLDADHGHGARHIPQLLKIAPHSRILALYCHKSQSEQVDALLNGASGLFSKHQRGDLLLKAVRTVSRGEPWFERGLGLLSLQTAQEQAQANRLGYVQTLNVREIKLAKLAAQGLSAKTIAEQVHLSHKTIRNQLSEIYRKLNVSNQLELCAKASQLGLNGD